MSESHPSKPRRRWWQFSLRTFFALVTMFCVWLGWTVHRANEQRKAAAWVREIDGVLWYDYEFDAGSWPIDNFRFPPRHWLAQILGDDYFQDVSNVRLDNTQVSDLTPLAKLASLQYLRLSSTPVSDLTPLVKLTSLQELYVDNTQVSDLTPLVKLQSLYWLDLSNTPVSEEQVETLQQALPNCEIIWSPPDPSP